jgi:hypothetical protein
MPTSQNWINFIYVNLGFMSQVIVMYYCTALIEIKKNWPQYRCNPIYMPLSDNITEDFTYCVQTTQINLMGYLLQPLTYLISSLSSIGSEFNKDINSIRTLFDFVRKFIASIVENIFGVFSNIVIEFQVITIGIKDMLGKLVAILVTLLYMMDGANKTMQSAWNGPPGQMVRTLCFHPDTSIKLQNNKVITMKDLELGNILCNNSKIYAIIKIDNTDIKEPLYKINNGVNNDPIYVTGSHYIWDKYSNIFIKVKNYKDAEIQTHIESDLLICLITTNHNITIGDHIFWDWEDDDLVNKKIMK